MCHSTYRSWTKCRQESKTGKNLLIPWKFTIHSKYFISILTCNINCSYVWAQIWCQRSGNWLELRELMRIVGQRNVCVISAEVVNQKQNNKEHETEGCHYKNTTWLIWGPSPQRITRTWGYMIHNGALGKMVMSDPTGFFNSKVSSLPSSQSWPFSPLGVPVPPWWSMLRKEL